MGPEYEPFTRPMDRFRAEGYPDDPEIVDDLYRVGLSLGAPQLRCSGPAYFPAPAPAGPSVTIGASASSSAASRLFPPGGHGRGSSITYRRRGALMRVGAAAVTTGLPHAWPDGASGQGYPVLPRAAHREGPRESARYAYRGTIVGEASHPGLFDPRVGPQSGPPAADRGWSLIGPREDDPCHSSRGGSPAASSLGESRRPCRETSPACCGRCPTRPRGGRPCSLDGGSTPEASPMGKSGCGHWCFPFKF